MVLPESTAKCLKIYESHLVLTMHDGLATMMASRTNTKCKTKIKKTDLWPERDLESVIGVTVVSILDHNILFSYSPNFTALDVWDGAHHSQ